MIQVIFYQDKQLVCAQKINRQSEFTTKPLATSRRLSLYSALNTLPVKTLILCYSPHAATEHVIGTTLEDMFDHLIRLHTWKTVFGIKTAATATKPQHSDQGSFLKLLSQLTKECPAQPPPSDSRLPL